MWSMCWLCQQQLKRMKISSKKITIKKRDNTDIFIHTTELDLVVGAVVAVKKSTRSHQKYESFRPKRSHTNAQCEKEKPTDECKCKWNYNLCEGKEVGVDEKNKLTMNDIHILFVVCYFGRNFWLDIFFRSFFWMITSKNVEKNCLVSLFQWNEKIRPVPLCVYIRISAKTENFIAIARNDALRTHLVIIFIRTAEE